MAAIKNIEPKVLRKRVGPMRAFPSDESVHALGSGDFHFRARAARHNADAATNLRAAWKQFRGRAGRLLKATLEFGARDFQIPTHAQVPPLFEKEWLQFSQADRAREQRVVAERGMRIERQMR